MIDYLKYREEFDSLIDEIGEIEIGSNFSMLPSQVLLEMDKTAYKEQLIDYVNQKKEDHSQAVYDRFPAPIAYFYHQTERAYDNEQQRLQLLRSTWEALIYLLYSLVLGEVNFKKFSLSNVRIFDNKRIKKDYKGLMSDKLGLKIEVMQKIVDYDQQNTNTLELSSCVNTDSFETIKELNQERNSISHTSALSEQEASDRLEELYPIVSDLLFELDFLENVTLLKYVNTIGDIHKIRFNKFEGHSLQKQNYEKTFSDDELALIAPILNDQNISLEFNSMFFNISPFIHFHLEGSQLKLCYFKKIDNLGNYSYEIIGGASRKITKEPSTIPNCINLSLGELL